ncbi:MAG TPA: pimeloyl-ACP methyl ester esterase BioH [Casimicrobiaceae bacterium]|nr:pimeloyl-ACP methyl ester esterase BioH [Casimicrobiaceae bacterium]
MSALHVETVGSGPPLVLLHGWAMHSGIWGSLVVRLARRFRVHAVDLPGHGHSRSAPADSFTLDGACVAVAASIPADAGPLTVVGWSLGGLVAMRWARQEPNRVRRLALVSTSPRFTAAADWPHAASGETLARFGDELHVAWKLTIQRFLSLQLQGSEHGRATLATLRQQVFARGQPSQRALFGALETLATADLRGEVAGIAQPAIVVAGGRDTLAYPGAGQWLAERLPDARYAPIDGAAHVPFLSHPDSFAAALDPFLDGR